jgi:hypothetical protein
MKDAGMVRRGCPVASPDQLRRVEINHHGFDAKTHRGVLVVKADTADSVVRVFTELFELRLPHPADENPGGVRRRQHRQPGRRQHRRLQLPPLRADQRADHGVPARQRSCCRHQPARELWQDLRCKCWKPSAKHGARSQGKGRILEGGPVWRAFTAEGWVWQNIDVPDYMHFDTGYPSRPYGGPSADAR